MKQSKVLCVVLSLLVLAFGIFPMAFAEDEAAAGVAGCGSVKVDPNDSLGAQQVICNGAESNAASSCTASGHGICSSPKLNDVLPEADHCVCIGENVVPTEPVS